MALAASLISAIYILGYCLKGSVVVYFLLSLVLQYYAYRTKNSTLFVLVLIFIAFIGFLVLYLFKEAVVDFIVKISPSDRLTVRLITLVDADNEAANIKTITGRTDLYMLSLDTWVSNFGNFFFGIGDHRVMRGARATGIGQHADLLDSLARYGVMGLVILFSVFKYVFKFILSLFDKKYKLQLIAIFVIFMMCGLTKGLFYPGIGCAMFVLLPLSKEFVKQK